MYKIYTLVPKKEIIVPKGGWKENTYYVVQVSYSQTNPIHTAILGVRFLQKDGSPGSYSEIWCTNYDSRVLFRDAWYIEVVKVIGKLRE